MAEQAINPQGNPAGDAGARSEEVTEADLAGPGGRRSRPPPPMSIVFFNPQGFFRWCADTFYYLRYTRYLVAPLAVFGLLIWYHEWYTMEDNLTRVTRSFGFLGSMLIGLFACNFLSRITSGTAMAMAEVDSQQFGMRLLMGLVPRFFIDRSGIKTLNYKGQRRQYSVALLTRLAVFGVGLLIWAMSRRSGSGSADFALAVGMSGFMSFLFTANPLWFADGGMWLSAYFERNKLRTEAFQVVGMVLRRRPLPSSLRRREAVALFVYAMACVVFTAVIAALVIWVLATALEAQFRGTGVVIFCIILAIAILSLVSLGRRGGKKPGQKRGQTRDQQKDQQGAGRPGPKAGQNARQGRGQRPGQKPGQKPGQNRGQKQGQRPGQMPRQAGPGRRQDRPRR